MKREELKRYIEGILFDVKGDNEYPEDAVVLANASLIMSRIDKLVDELREESRDLHTTVIKKKIEPDDLKPKYYDDLLKKKVN